MKEKMLVFIITAMVLFTCKNNPSGPEDVVDPEPIVIYYNMGQGLPGSEPEIFAPGFICQSDRFEFGGSFSPDGKEFYYTVSSSDWQQNRILCTKFVDSAWTSPSVLPISGADIDWRVLLSPDGERLFFSSGRPSHSWTLNIWMSDRNDSTWSEPVELGINSSVSDYAGTTTDNGTLYFFSRRDGDVAIYKSELGGDQYSNSEKLPSPINIDGISNGGAFIYPDESFLLFYSDREGNSDIYISFRNGDGSWKEPVSMGEKINTDLSEQNPFLSPDGEYLFFHRDNGPQAANREIDLYWVEFLLPTQ